MPPSNFSRSYSTPTRMKMISDEDTRLPLGLLVLYDLLPWLTVGLRGCMYYWQRLTVVAVLLVCTLSSRRWRLWVFQRLECPPQIVAAQKQAAKKNVRGIWSKRYGMYIHGLYKSVSVSSVWLGLMFALYNSVGSFWLGLMFTLYNSQCFACFIRTRVCYVWVAGRKSKCPPVAVYGECAVTCE